MTTIAEMFVNVGADVSEFENEIDGMGRQFQRISKGFNRHSYGMNKSMKGMSQEAQSLKNEMKMAFMQQRQSMIKFKEEQIKVKHGFFQMSKAASTYKGTSKQFMDDVIAMGKKMKKVKDDILRNNEMAKMGLIKSVGTLLARSTQSEKIAENFDRMNNPLYKVNNGLLKITNNFEKMAKAGQPAALALKMLGPTANMKQLRDMTTLISRGLMRVTFVALGAGIATGIMFKGLHDAAKDSVPGYEKAFQDMLKAVREAFQPMVEVFAQIMMPVYKFITAVAKMVKRFNEAHPTLAKIIQGFLMLIPLLTLILSPLAIGIGLFAGMKAAFAATWMLIGPLITGLGAMMGTVILVAAAIALVTAGLMYLWKNNEGFRNAVISAWESIKNTAQKVWNFIYNNAIKPAIEAIVSFVREKIAQIKQWWAQNGDMILQATSNIWGFVSAKIKQALTIISNIFQVVFPIIKEIVVSTWNFIKDAITAAIDIITGVINFFAALFTGDWEALWEATKQILSGAVTLLVSLFKNSFIGKIIGILISFGQKAISTFSKTWNNIKTATSIAVTFIKNFISTRFAAAKSLIANILNSIRQAFVNTWNRIKSAVSNAINNVKTIIGNGIRGALNIVRNLGTAFYNAGKKIVTMIADGIKAAIGKVTDAIGWVAKKARDYLPFSPAKIGPLSDLHQLDFGGPITDSVAKAAPIVQKMLGKVLTLPPLNTANLGYSMDFTNNLEAAPLNHEFAPIYVHITGETGQLNNDAIARAVEKRITQNLKHGARRLPNRAAFSGVR